MMAREDLKHADLLAITEGYFLNTNNALIIDFRKTNQQDLHAAGTKSGKRTTGHHIAN